MTRRRRRTFPVRTRLVTEADGEPTGYRAREKSAARQAMYGTASPPRRKPARPLKQSEVWEPADLNRKRPAVGPLSVARILRLRSMPYREYLLTPEWAARRLGKIMDADGRCQVCNSAKDLEVHHRTYARRGAERWNDLVVLCAECHGLFSEHGKLAPEPSGS